MGGSEASVETAPDTESTAETDPANATRTASATAEPPSLGSRILVTWAELTAVGVLGGLFSATVEGPVGFIVYLALSLASVGILLYNVTELVKGWVAAGVPEADGD